MFVRIHTNTESSEYLRARTNANISRVKHNFIQLGGRGIFQRVAHKGSLKDRTCVKIRGKISDWCYEWTPADTSKDSYWKNLE